MSIEIANESGVEVNELALASLARYVLDEMGVHPLAELSVLLVDEPAMTELHVRWMGEEGPTDVLAFPMDELRPPQPGGMPGEHDPSDPSGIPGLVGDVVICPQVAAAQASQAKHSTAEEIDLLCTHGILHLLGYDHAETGQLATMFALQDRLLASWRASLAGGDQPGDLAVNDPVIDGPVVDGPVVDGPLVDGTAVDGPVVDGTAVEDTVGDHTVGESAG